MWEESIIFLIIYLGLFFIIPDNIRIRLFTDKYIVLTATVFVFILCVGIYGIYKHKQISETFAGLGDLCGPSLKRCGVENPELTYCLINTKTLRASDVDQSVIFNIYGRYVRISRSNTNLLLSQVIVLNGAGVNIARDKTTSVSSTKSGAAASSVVVDGTATPRNRNQSWESNTNASSEYWQVDLGSIDMITTVRIIGCADYGDSINIREKLTPDTMKDTQILVLKTTDETATPGTCVAPPTVIFPIGTTVNEQKQIGPLILDGMNGQIALTVLRGIQSSTATSLTVYGLTDSQAADAYNKLYLENLNLRKSGWRFSASWNANSNTLNLISGSPPNVNMTIRSAPGIPSGTQVTSVSGNTITLNANTKVTYNGAVVTVDNYDNNKVYNEGDIVLLNNMVYKMKERVGAPGYGPANTPQWWTVEPAYKTTQSNAFVELNGDIDDNTLFSFSNQIRSMTTVSSITYDKSAALQLFMSQNKKDIPTEDSLGAPVLNSSGVVVKINDNGATDALKVIMSVTKQKAADPSAGNSYKTNPVSSANGVSGYSLSSAPNVSSWSSDIKSKVPQQATSINLEQAAPVIVTPETTDAEIASRSSMWLKNCPPSGCSSGGNGAIATSQSVNLSTMTNAATDTQSAKGYKLPEQSRTSVSTQNLPKDVNGNAMPDVVIGREVFWLGFTGNDASKNFSTQSEANQACIDAGADRLATYAELNAAFTAGAQWCSPGWVSGTTLKYYPMQEVKENCSTARGLQTGNESVQLTYNGVAATVPAYDNYRIYNEGDVMLFNNVAYRLKERIGGAGYGPVNAPWYWENAPGYSFGGNAGAVCFGYKTTSRTNPDATKPFPKPFFESISTITDPSTRASVWNQKSIEIISSTPCGMVDGVQTEKRNCNGENICLKPDLACPRACPSGSSLKSTPENTSGESCDDQTPGNLTLQATNFRGTALSNAKKNYKVPVNVPDGSLFRIGFTNANKYVTATRVTDWQGVFKYNQLQQHTKTDNLNQAFYLEKRNSDMNGSVFIRSKVDNGYVGNIPDTWTPYLITKTVSTATGPTWGEVYTDSKIYQKNGKPDFAGNGCYFTIDDRWDGWSNITVIYNTGGKGPVWDVRGNVANDGAAIILYRNNGQGNQAIFLEYVELNDAGTALQEWGTRKLRNAWAAAPMLNYSGIMSGSWIAGTKPFTHVAYTDSTDENEIKLRKNVVFLMQDGDYVKMVQNDDVGTSKFFKIPSAIKYNGADVTVADYDNDRTYNTGDIMLFNNIVYRLKERIGAAGYGPVNSPNSWENAPGYSSQASNGILEYEPSRWATYSNIPGTSLEHGRYKVDLTPGTSSIANTSWTPWWRGPTMDNWYGELPSSALTQTIKVTSVMRRDNMVKGRYLKIRPSRSHGDGYLNFSQIVVRDSLGNNIAKDKTVTATSNWGGPSKTSTIVDGSERERTWESGGVFHTASGSRDTEYVLIDFGHIYTISSITYYGRSGCSNCPDRTFAIRLELSTGRAYTWNSQ